MTTESNDFGRRQPRSLALVLVLVLRTEASSVILYDYIITYYVKYTSHTSTYSTAAHTYDKPPEQ